MKGDIREPQGLTVSGLRGALWGDRERKRQLLPSGGRSEHTRKGMRHTLGAEGQMPISPRGTGHLPGRLCGGGGSISVPYGDSPDKCNLKVTGFLAGEQKGGPTASFRPTCRCSKPLAVCWREAQSSGGPCSHIFLRLFREVLCGHRATPGLSSTLPPPPGPAAFLRCHFQCPFHCQDLALTKCIPTAVKSKVSAWARCP